jgi:hypothetical protein
VTSLPSSFAMVWASAFTSAAGQLRRKRHTPLRRCSEDDQVTRSPRGDAGDPPGDYHAIGSISATSNNVTICGCVTRQEAGRL